MPLRNAERCRGHSRHWFTLRAAWVGGTGYRSPKCIRCGAPNPQLLTTDDWRVVLEFAPALIDDPEGLREALETDSERGDVP